MTPLIDVVFILLIFFMLASSFLDWRSVNLDSPVQATGGGGADGAVLIDVLADGSVTIGGEILTLESLTGHMAAKVAEDPDQRVLVRADTGVSVQRVVTVLDVLDGAGVTAASLLRATPQ